MCMMMNPTSYTVTSSDYEGACGAARTIRMFTKEGFSSALMFWEEGDTTDYPRIREEYGDFYADLHWKEFSSMYHIFKEEKNVEVVFRCDGQGGYREIHVSGGSKTEELKQMTETLMAKKPCAAIASPVG